MRILNKRNLPTKSRSKKSEARAATLFGGKKQIASGALPSVFLKGDVKSDTFIVDDKTTGAASFGVTMNLWQKLSREAWMNNRRPALRLEFSEHDTTLVVLDAQTFSDLLNKTL